MVNYMKKIAKLVLGHYCMVEISVASISMPITSWNDEIMQDAEYNCIHDSMWKSSIENVAPETKSYDLHQVSKNDTGKAQILTQPQNSYVLKSL